jgi:NitT/TauT family transport system substrate-binding protein
MRGRAAGLATVGMVALLVAGCSSPVRPSGSPSGGAGGAPVVAGSVTGQALRVGFIPAVMDAPVLVGLQQGTFIRDLGRAGLEPVAFPSVPAETAALEDGQLDAAYLDPVAAVAAWQSSRWPVRVVAGVASGGAEFVVRKSITSLRQLARVPLSAPAGTAQEAALDTWLRGHGLPALGRAGAAVMPVSALVHGFRAGQIAGGWELAPADVKLVAAGGRVLVNEASLWPGGRFSTAVLVVTQRLLARDPGAVTGLLRAQIQADEFIAAHRVPAAAAVNQELSARAGAALGRGVLAASLAQLSFTTDPLATSMVAEARRAAAAGLIKPVRSLDGLFDLAPLNALLRASGQRTVTG